MKLFSLFVCLAAVVALSSAKSYKDHKVVSFTVENELQLKELQDLEGETGFIFLEPPMFVNTKLSLVMQPELFPLFEELAASSKLSYKIGTHDLQSVIDAEKPLKQRKDGFELDRYHELDEIYEFLEETAAKYPETVTVFTFGETYEGRLMKAIRISTNDSNPAAFIESNIHAREWISSATSLWIINEILTTQDPAIREVVDSITWYFVPIANPDGYHYTHHVNRLWRKTRSVHNILCRGVDPNRNFGFNWMEGGSSKLACSDTYAGPSAFSEKETRALMDFYGTVANKTDLYICFHSAAQMLMYPLGNTNSTENVPNANDLQAIAKASAEALAVRYQTVYAYGNAMNTLYVTSGSSRDHAYGHFETPLVFTYEMREGPENIFIFPADKIGENAEEIFDSLIAMVQTAKSLNYFKQKV